MPYLNAQVILLFRGTSADKRVALYLHIGLHYLMREDATFGYFYAYFMPFHLKKPTK